MAKYMYTFRKRLEKLIDQGFIIPSYIMRIKHEKTARKYTAAEIIKRSKYVEVKDGKERIVKGERGLELQRSKAAKKGARTKRQKELDDFWRRINSSIDVSEEDENPFQWVGEYPKPDGRRANWDDIKNNLESRIRSLLDSFVSQKLANQLRWLFDKNSKDDPTAFWSYILALESRIIEKLEEHAVLNYNDVRSLSAAYTYWESVLKYGESPDINDLQDIADGIDSDDDASDMTI